MAKGKYAKVIDQLRRELGTEPQYQEKVNAVKDQIVAPTENTVDEASIDLMLDQIENDLSTLNNLLLHAANGKRHATVLARVYKLLRRTKDLFEKQEKDTNLLLEAYTQLLTNQYEAEGTTSVRLDSGETVSVQYEPKALVKDRDALRTWAITMGMERALMLPWMTVNALTKERLLAGEPEPDGVEAVSIVKMVLRG